MKNLLFILVLIPAFCFANTDPVSSLSAITKAISDGNATALGSYFDKNVEIAVLDNEDVYSKTEAINVVKNFFAKNKPESFSQVHQGTSKGKDSKYCIGNLVSGKGTYRVYVYMKVSGGDFLIQELRFDKE